MARAVASGIVLSDPPEYTQPQSQAKASDKVAYVKLLLEKQVCHACLPPHSWCTHALQ